MHVYSIGSEWSSKENTFHVSNAGMNHNRQRWIGKEMDIDFPSNAFYYTFSAMKDLY